MAPHLRLRVAGMPGRYVPLNKTVNDFARIIKGECDDIPEQAFYMVGDLDDVFDKAEKLKREEG